MANYKFKVIFHAILGNYRLKIPCSLHWWKKRIGKMVRDEKIDKKMQVFSSSNAFLVQLKNASRCGIIDMLFPSYSLPPSSSKIQTQNPYLKIKKSAEDKK